MYMSIFSDPEHAQKKLKPVFMNLGKIAPLPNQDYQSDFQNFTHEPSYKPLLHSYQAHIGRLKSDFQEQ